QACQLIASGANLLRGSRIAIASAELRVPLIQPTSNRSSIPPIDGHVFYDAGIAWTSDSQPTFERGILGDPSRRGILTSAGVGVRTNLFGFAVLEVDYVRAFEAGTGWKWV